MNRRMFISSITTALAAMKLAPPTSTSAPSAAATGIRQPATLLQEMPDGSLLVTSGGRGYIYDARALAAYAHSISAREYVRAIEHVGE